MKLRRIGAFFIDMIIVSFVSSLLLLIPAVGYDATKIENIVDGYVDKIMSSGSADIDEEETITVMHDLSVEGLPSSMVMVVVTFLYFGTFGYLNNGVTFGKKIFKLKIVNATDGLLLDPSLFILREVLLLGIVFKILGIAVTIIYKDAMTWYSAYSMINNISILVTFLIYGFIIFRDDERGLHDIIGKTKVISTKENTNEA